MDDHDKAIRVIVGHENVTVEQDGTEAYAAFGRRIDDPLPAEVRHHGMSGVLAVAIRGVEFVFTQGEDVEALHLAWREHFGS